MNQNAGEICDLVSAARLREIGLAVAREGHFRAAIDQFHAALKVDPDHLETVRYIAQACTDAGQLVEAEEAWLHYIARRQERTADAESACQLTSGSESPPSDEMTLAEVYRHLGTLRRRMDKLDLAIESFQKAASLDPNSVVIHIDLGIAFAKTKNYTSAKNAFNRALELQPDHYDALINLGMLQQEMGEGKDAVTTLRRAIELRPDDPSGLNNLGVALAEQGQVAESIDCYEKLLVKHPNYVLAWNNLGNSLRAAGRNDDAVTALQKALELQPDYCEAYNNLGIIYSQMEKFSDAIRCYDKALLLRPDYPEAHANRGLVYLLLGNFQQGWADYEWRWQGGHGLKRRNYPAKVWDGSPLTGKKILLYYEQGLGDTFQFIRYARELKNRGATVVFECQPPMRQILSRTPGIDTFVNRGETPPPCDFYAPLLSLPGLCQTNLDTIPRRVPYVFPDPELVWDWKQRMAKVDGFRIGIVWQGNPQHKGDKNRSIPLKQFKAIAQIPGVTLITLQKNFGIEQLEQLKGEFSVLDFKGIAEESDGFLRTAAIMANLDLVITADTSVGHLAGAMGVPIWMALPTSPDWRWLLEREDTPWYPTMRLFRQNRAGDWSELFDRIVQALKDRLAISNRSAREPANTGDVQECQRLVLQASECISKNDQAKAQELLESAVRLDPTNASAHQDLGVTYARQGRIRDGIACFRRALELAPDSPGSYSNLGLACYHLGLIDEAVSHLRKAIWLGASSVDTYKNLALALTAVPDPAAAEEAYWSALRLRPDDAEAHYHLAQVQLLQGKFEQGWLEYEWRWRWRNTPKQQQERPRWSGQKLDGKYLLIRAEDDSRDTIQFIRYADVLAQQGCHIAVECQPSLVKLINASVGVERVITVGDPPLSYDFQIPLLSLPATCGTTLNTVPAARPYLGVNTQELEKWRQNLAGLSGVKIGIAMDAGSEGNKREPLMSVPWPMLDHLIHLEGTTWINLQITEDNLRESSFGRGAVPPRVISLSERGNLPQDAADLWETMAAAIRCLDLLITADNTLAHIAGAMGVSTWVLLPRSAPHRWLINREDHPWYPNMRLFRQHVRGDWSDVLNRITLALTDILSQHRRNHT